MLKGFRDFILRGSIVDLAVAVVIGTAFTALVSQFTKSFITPLIAVFTGGGEPSSTFSLRGVVFGYGAFLAPSSRSASPLRWSTFSSCCR